MDSVREFLESAKWAHMKAARLSRKIEQLTTQVEHITPSYSGMPGGGGSDPSSAWAALAQLRSEYQEELAKAEAQEKAVADFVEAMPTPVYREILMLRYCEGLRWPLVGQAMEKSGCYYSDRHIFKLHGRALQEAREIWKEKENEQTRDLG